MILLDNGSLWAYGENEEGAINGERVSDYLYEPEKVADGIQSVATADRHTLAINDEPTESTEEKVLVLLKQARPFSEGIAWVLYEDPSGNEQVT